MLQVNLLPWRKLRCQKRSRYWMRLFVGLPALMLSGVLILSAFKVQERELLALHLSAVSSASQKLMLQQARVTSASAQVKVLAGQRQISLERAQRSRNYLQLLALLSERIPADVWLSELTDHQDLLMLKGEGRFYHDILAFRERLAASELLGDVNLSDIQQQPNRALSFVLRTRFRPVISLSEQETLP